jgi:photosynthetic reaction center cytochrome c subunit
MKANKRLGSCLVAVAVASLLLGISERLKAQGEAAKSTPQQQQTAGQKFKNIKVLNDIPAEQLFPSMQFITASLGVDCEFCHVEHAPEKDDKKEKITARKMITMMMAINKANFDDEREVTCYSCHRGAAHPVGTPILSAGAAPAMHMHEEEGAEQPAFPAAKKILDSYLAAVGGADALTKIKTRVQKGNIDAFGDKYPIEVYSEAPDKRVSISHPKSGDSVTAFNGEVGWLALPRGMHPMNPAEAQAASIDAQLYFPARLPSLYQEFRVRPGETIDGRPTYQVSAKGKNLPPMNLYFDQENGMLLRMIRYAETPLGRNPTEIDYADFRVVDGVKIPFRWTLARPNGSFTIQVEDVKQNVPVDQKLFVMPSGGEKH